MDIPIERIKKYRRLFAWGFVVPLLIMGFIAAVAADTGIIRMLLTKQIDTATVIALAAFLTSATSLVGLIVTTIMTWRKDYRETEHAPIELEKKKLELEKFRREIRDKNAAAQEKKKKMTKRRPFR
jgi:hypothetical protein